MMTNEFGSLKRRIYLAYHQDGILDLVAGSVVVGFGAFMLTDNIAFMIFGWLAMMLYVLIKQRITVPRFGFVRIESEKTSFRKGLISVGVGVLLFFFFLTLNIFVSRKPTSPDIQALIQSYHMIPLSGMMFGLPSLVGAIYLGLKRFYLYAFLAVGLPALGAWLNTETYIPIIAIGLIVLAFGLILLINFLKKYQIKEEAGEDAHE